MTDERDRTDASGDAGNESTPPVAGERLAEARREHQIGVHEVAKRLHLDEAKVRALERNDFDVLGAPVFAKGHLRKYADLVGIEKDDIIADYYQMTHLADLPPVVNERPRLRQHMSPVPWTIAFIVVVAGGALYWWLTTDRGRAGFLGMPFDDVPVDTSPADSRPAVDSTLGGLPADSGQTNEPEAVVETAAEEARDVSLPQPEGALPDLSAPQGQLSAAAGQTQLRIRYSGDCWTEISDADGKRLFFDMGRAGRTVEVAGIAPFSMLFGNSENVSLQVNGADYPVLPNTPGSRTARLTVMKP
jgi:cytoskeleton protein RodZ